MSHFCGGLARLSVYTNPVSLEYNGETAGDALDSRHERVAVSKERRRRLGKTVNPSCKAQKPVKRPDVAVDGHFVQGAVELVQGMGHLFSGSHGVS